MFNFNKPTINTSTFGNTSAAQSTSTFGSNAQSQPQANSQPAGGGFSFGQSSTQAPQTNLFGQSTAPTQSNLFGQSATQQTQSQGGFSFGATKPQQTTSLFGQSQPQQSTQISSFGAQTQPQTASLFQPNTSLFGASTQPQAANTSMFGQTQGIPQLTPNTKFLELPENIQKQLEEFNKTVYTQSHKADSLDIAYTNQVLEITTNETLKLKKKFAVLKKSIEQDDALTTSLKQQSTHQVTSAEGAYRIHESMMKSGGPGSTGVAERPFYHMDDLILKYFFALAEKLYVQLDQNKQTIDALMRHVGDASKSRPPRPQVIIDIVKNNYDLLLSLAGRVSNLNEMVEERRDSYLQWRRMNGLDVVDPFGSHSKMIGNAVTDGLLMSIDNVSLSEIAMRITQK